MALAKASRFIDTESALKKRVVDLFRRCCRSAKKVGIMYTIELTPAQIRRLVNLQFKKNMGLTDPRVIDMLVVQGEMELEETMNQWKMKPHVMQLLETSAVLDPKPEAPDLPDLHGGQAWMKDLVAAAELEAGVPADAKRAERLAAAAADMIRGDHEAPGSEVAPAMPAGVQELWDDMRTSGRTRVPDRLLTGESPGDARTIYIRNKSSRLPPELLQQMREAVDAGELSPEEELDLARIAEERSARQQLPGDAQAYRIAPSTRAEALLPPWLASRTRRPQACGDFLSEQEQEALREAELAVARASDAPLPPSEDKADEDTLASFRATQEAAAEVYDMFLRKRQAALRA